MALSADQRRLLRALDEHGELTLTEMAERADVSMPEARQAMPGLVEPDLGRGQGPPFAEGQSLIEPVGDGEHWRKKA